MQSVLHYFTSHCLTLQALLLALQARVTTSCVCVAIGDGVTLNDPASSPFSFLCLTRSMGKGNASVGEI